MRPEQASHLLPINELPDELPVVKQRTQSSPVMEA